MAYIKFDLERHKEFLLEPEGKCFLVHLASTIDDCETLENIIEFKHTPQCVLAVILERFTKSENAKWFDNVRGYYVLQSIAKDTRTDALMLKMLYEHINEVYNYYLNNESSYPCVLMDTIVCIAANENVSEELMRKLLDSENHAIEEAIASNKKISNNLLIQIIENTSSDSVKAAALEQVVERLKALDEQPDQDT